jgi:hypothetical protein
MVHLYTGLLLIHKNDYVSMCTILDELCKHYAKWEKDPSQNTMYFMIPFI